MRFIVINLRAEVATRELFRLVDALPAVASRVHRKLAAWRSDRSVKAPCVQRSSLCSDFGKTAIFALAAVAGASGFSAPKRAFSSALTFRSWRS